jgi:hypothetical protein
MDLVEHIMDQRPEVPLGCRRTAELSHSEEAVLSPAALERQDVTGR